MSCLGVVSHDILADIPLIRVLLVATNERELTRKRIRCLQVRQVLATIERLYIKTFISSPDQALLEVGTLQVNLDFVEPLLGSRRLELGKEFFFVCHKYFCVYYIRCCFKYYSAKIQTNFLISNFFIIILSLYIKT